MSQGTPSKEGRIERHLMRQRGAGVRAITADFGFSFAPSIVPRASNIEPPAKRRKTIARKGSQDEKSGSRSCATRIGTLEKNEHNAAVSTTDARPHEWNAQKTCDEAPRDMAPGSQATHEPRDAGTVAGATEKIGIESMRKEILGGTTTTIPGITMAASTEDVVLPQAGGDGEGATQKAGRNPIKRAARSTEKAMDAVNDADETGKGGDGVDDSFIAGLKPRKRMKATKKQTAAPEVKAVPRDSARPDTVQAATTPPTPVTAKKRTDVKATKKQTAASEVKDIPQDLARPGTVDVAATPPAPTTAKKRTAGKRRVKDFDDPTEVPASPFNDRPRRKAAASAVKKLYVGFEQETSCVEKPRRAEEPSKSTTKGRKHEVVAVDEASLTPADEDAWETSKQPPKKSRVPNSSKPTAKGQKRGATASGDLPVPQGKGDPPVNAAQPSTVEVRTATVPVKKLGRARKAPPKQANPIEVSAKLSAILGDDWLELDLHSITGRTPKPPPTEHKPMPPKKRRRNPSKDEEAEPGSPTARKKRATIDKATLPAMEKTGSAQASNPSEFAAPVTKRKRKLQDTDGERSGVAALPKKRRALAQTDGNIARLSVSPEKPDTKAEPTVVAASGLASEDCVGHEATNVGARARTKAVKSRRRISADEDIDWLFAASDVKRRRAPAAGVRLQ